MNQLISKKFVSVFKVDGVPILPPLITSEKRKILQQYKEEAILIENNLTSRKQTKEIPISEEFGLLQDTELTYEDDFLKISNFLQSKVKLTNPINNNTSSIQDLQKSDTLIYDVINNTVIIPYDSKSSDSYSDLNQFLQFNEKSYTYGELKNSDSQSNQCKTELPSVVVKPPTPDNCSEILLSPNKINETNKLQKVISPSDNDKLDNTPTTLIRTNSFILDKASSVLVEHMDKLAINEQQQKQHHNETVTSISNTNIPNKKKSSFIYNKSPKIVGYKKKGMLNICDKIEIKKENIFNNTALFKNKKSPYELDVSRKIKSAKKHKSPILKTSSNITLKTKSCNTSMHNKNKLNDNETLYYTQAFEDIEKEHKLQLMELTKKHEDEQNRMKESFEYKQKLLLEHLESQINIVDNQNCSNDQTEIYTLEKNQNSNKLSKTNILSSSSSRFFNNKFDNKNVLKESANNNMTYSTDRREFAAATIINKYVRGYLTRRILKTFYVQRIVMIIRDTLLFAINLYKQTKFSDNSDNIKLKMRLLQQLRSSCYNLHHIFFELSTKQRMTLISKDRMYKINNKFYEEN